MQLNRIFITIWCFFALVVFLPGAAGANGLAITDLGVDNSAGAVSVGFSIVVTDMAPLMEALKNGGEYRVQCTTRLYHRRAGFWNSFLSEGAYSSVITSKPIARECQVLDERGTHTYPFQGLQEELNRHWSRLSIPMGNWDRIERGSAYRVVMTFRVTRTDISSWVSKPLFFVSWDLVPEVVYEFDFDF